MKKDLKRAMSRLIGSMLATAMLFSGTVIPEVDYLAPVVTEAAESGVVITESGGWMESAYVEWSDVTSATSYKVYVKLSSAADSAYTQLDNELIRRYSGYWRADALGITAGEYTMKVTAFKDTTELSSATATMKVTAQDRSGFAFKGTTTPGAYKADGTLKSGAQVIYLTNDDFSTKKVTIKGKNGVDTECTGFGDIIKTLAYAYNAPTAIRIIGKIDASHYNNFTLSEGCVQMKGMESGYNKSDNTGEVTIEGVGEDAVLGGGLSLYKASYIELRNYAVGLFLDDGVSLKQTTHSWIHNLELMYGSTGGDTDQAKGDGSIDLKDDSQYVTISYNHFWDSGKCSLCGMKSESGPNYITYHHNWFDHSDSRHPRIRTMSVHIYNNFFDGNAKYGVGLTSGGSAFVENNVFENCKHPMMISNQGTDATGAGTFSGEAGGVIKAYNNKISGAQAGEPIYYSSSVTQDWDAYLATSRDETVPSSVKAKDGGSTYDNSGLAVSNLNAIPESVDTVKGTVTTYAGRMNGGDFKWTFTDADNTDYAVIPEMKTYIASYIADKGIISVGGNTDGKIPETTTSTSETTTKEGVTETTTKASSETTTKASGGDGTTETTTSAPAGSPVAMGSYTLNSSTLEGKECSAFGMTFVLREANSTGVKLRSANSITFTVDKNCTLTMDPSGKGLTVNASSGSVDGASSVTTGVGEVTVTLTPGTYVVTGAESGSNTTMTKMVFVSTGGDVDTTTTEVTTEATTTTVAPTTTTEATTTTVAPTTTTEVPTETTTEAPTETTTEAPVQEIINSDYELTPSDFDADTLFTKIGDFSSNSATRIRLQSANSLKFTVAKGATVTISGRHASSTDSAVRTLNLLDSKGTAVGSHSYAMGEAEAAIEYAVNLEAGTYTLQADNHLNISSISITFPNVESLKGDANGDGVVDIYDVTAIMKYVINKENAVDTALADVNGDGKVTSYDAYLIRRFLLGYTQSL